MDRNILKHIYMRGETYFKERRDEFMLRIMPHIVKSYITHYSNEFWSLLINPYMEDIGTVGLNNLSTREKWLEETLLKIPTGHSILDAGAGELQYKKFCEHLIYTSQDFGQYDGTGDASGLQIGSWDNSKLDIISDITSVPKPDESFDAVMCIEVLEHVPEPVAAMREIIRLLRPNGYLVVTAPFASLTHFSPYFFHTGLSRYFYEHWCKEFNLDILDLQFNGNYFEYLAQELRRLPDISIRYAGKSISDVELLFSKALLSTLNDLSSKESGSNQLLSFGIHLLAQKKIV